MAGGLTGWDDCPSLKENNNAIQSNIQNISDCLENLYGGTIHVHVHNSRIFLNYTEYTGISE